MADQDPTSKPKRKPASVRDALSRVKAEETPSPAAATPAYDPPRTTYPPQQAAPSREGGFNIALTNPGPLDRAIFCRQFATLADVGIPVLKALRMLAERTPHLRLRRAVAETAQGVEEGQQIHVAMEPNVNIFSRPVVNIVRVGEVGGILESSLVRLADIMETKARIRRRIISASMYPAVALLVAVGMIILIMTKAIPAFEQAYVSSGHADDMPRMTQMVIGMSRFFVSFWWLVILLIAGAVAGIGMWSRTAAGNRFFSWFYLRMPVLRGVNMKIATARFTRSLGGLLRAGIPLTEALSITADSSENVLVADALHNVVGRVQTGERMAGPLARDRVFPPMVIDMIAIGEETGTLDTMLEKVAGIYEEEVDATLAGLTSIIEPLLIIVLGGIVIFIAMSVLWPYFNLVNVIGE